MDVAGVRASVAGLRGGRGRNSRNGWSQNSEQVTLLLAQRLGLDPVLLRREER
jgi:hypothetical protein